VAKKKSELGVIKEQLRDIIMLELFKSERGLTQNINSLKLCPANENRFWELYYQAKNTLGKSISPQAETKLIGLEIEFNKLTDNLSQKRR
jgi:hypothetical protein